MERDDALLPAAFSARERDYIRRELDIFFSTLPRAAEGFMLRRWAGGARAGQPKLSPVVSGLLERELLRLDATLRPPRVFFTAFGLAALRGSHGQTARHGRNWHHPVIPWTPAIPTA